MYFYGVNKLLLLLLLSLSELDKQLFSQDFRLSLAQQLEKLLVKTRPKLTILFSKWTSIITKENDVFTLLIRRVF